MFYQRITEEKNQEFQSRAPIATESFQQTVADFLVGLYAVCCLQITTSRYALLTIKIM